MVVVVFSPTADNISTAVYYRFSIVFERAHFIHLQMALAALERHIGKGRQVGGG